MVRKARSNPGLIIFRRKSAIVGADVFNCGKMSDHP